MKDYQEYFYNLKKLNDLEKMELCLWFEQNIVGYREKEEEIWKVFYPAYQILSPEERYDFRDSYSYCFSVLAWRLINNLKTEELFDVIASVSFLGLLDGEDIWKKIVKYIDIKALGEEDTKRIYSNIKREILNSKEIIYVENEKYFTVSDLVNKINLFYQTDDNLSLAELFSKLENKIKIRLEEINIKDNEPTKILSLFKSLIEFFSGVDENNIYNLLFSINNPRQFEVYLNKNLETKNNYLEKTEEKVIVAEKKPEIVIQEKNIANLANSVPVKEIFENEVEFTMKKNDKKIEEKKVLKKVVNKKVDYNLIRMDIEMNFDMDDEANFIDLEAVLNKLEELKNKYNDNKILELYYFDEKENKFVWNDELLNS